MCKNIEATISQHPRVATTKTRLAQGCHSDTHFHHVSLCSFRALHDILKKFCRKTKSSENVTFADIAQGH